LRVFGTLPPEQAGCFGQPLRREVQHYDEEGREMLVLLGGLRRHSGS
jgi:hypothetical protein